VIIEVSVKTSCKKSEISLRGDMYHACLKGKPIHNSANIELIDLLSSYFNTSRSSVKILRGFKSRKKIVEILEE